ncbi:TfoX/Sxy family protein [Aeoliella sp.]|uniref:TfoX/Sxy family protein n=1 Tax=Aeoliella sp. TaxID=2795800 RepID=UPI003CCBD8BC
MEELRNLGPKSSAWLAAAGIESLADLRELGAVVAYARVRQQQRGVSLNLLWALEGALRDCDWRDLTDADKQRLRDKLAELDG